MSFQVPPSDTLENLYVDNYWLIDQFFGDRLWLAGTDGYGGLGDGTHIAKSSPVQTVAGGSNWAHVACGYTHTAAIKTDGTLWCWGSNYNGELGDGTNIPKSSPVQTIAGGTNWAKVSCQANNRVAAIKLDGTLWLWGSNGDGQLGDGTMVNKSSPVQTTLGGTDWKDVSCGYYNTAAIKNDGSLWIWGKNQYNSLGTGTNEYGVSAPVQTAIGGNDWEKVYCGQHFVAAIKTDGTLWMWGLNANGALGDGTTVNKSVPTQTVSGAWKDVSCGYHTAAIKNDGSLWLWGANWYGALGTGDTIDRSSPVQTSLGGTDWSRISCGYGVSTAIKNDGSLWGWGLNLYGALAGADTYCSIPTHIFAGNRTWKQVSCGGALVGAISVNNISAGF